MDDAVAADAVQALAELTEEMEQRGRTLARNLVGRRRCRASWPG